MGRGCTTFLVVALMTFNVMFLLIGAAILCFAIYCYVDSLIQSAVSRSGHADKMQNLLYALIGLGLLTIVVAVFGCCGAYHESRCLLGTYSICLTIMFGVEIATGALCLVFKVETEKRIIQALENIIMQFRNEPADEDFNKSDSYRDWIQKSLHCCGINGVDDYPGSNVPSSCCIPKHQTCPDKSASYSIGCRQVINDLVEEKFLTAISLIMSVPLSKKSIPIII
ncbi:Tetraspanin-33 isoform 5 [Schistosoma japonicum]|uniref:Tetraspanin n=1 Tax=Schistosoma japonicum TaxID=6182 RepID=A0A4Z2DQV2_SCHJA|nr:Tetraspanin-33 [Schistosoma japonicum]TNN18886.1 Tetraspanin-33 isoform 5 [Schistosoma japonicum]